MVLCQTEECTWKRYLKAFSNWFVNAGFFYLGWIVCIQQAKGAHPYIGPLVVLGILISHFTLHRGDKADFILLLTLTLLGTAIDSAYIAVGMLSYAGEYQTVPFIAPLWITSIWALYAIAINHSLSWLSYHFLLASGLGAMGAISSYLAGIKLGAAEPLWSESMCCAVVGAVWAVIVPLTLKFGRWLKQENAL